MNLLINLRTAFEDGMREDKCVPVLPQDGLALLAVIEAAKAMHVEYDQDLYTTATNKAFKAALAELEKT